VQCVGDTTGALCSIAEPGWASCVRPGWRWHQQLRQMRAMCGTGGGGNAVLLDVASPLAALVVGGSVDSGGSSRGGENISPLSLGADGVLLPCVCSAFLSLTILDGAAISSRGDQRRRVGWTDGGVQLAR